MRVLILLPILFLFTHCSTPNSPDMTDAQSWITPFEQTPNTTTTYAEAIAYYERLAAQYDQLQISTFGDTDSGNPLHEVVLSKDKIFDPTAIRASGKRILMVNNAIHPGEPCGVDASMMLLRDYLQNPNLQAELDSLVIVLIPIYNIGGALNRNSATRTNQDGPESYGFRGNARHLDLNRDFIKCDSRNARSFNQFFAKWQPDVLVDNHTSNGADYTYTMTLIATQHNKLGGPLADYMNNSLLPRLYKDMAANKWEMTPYVNARDIPDNGIAEFLDYGRYSSGYAALFNTLSFMPETHMLKPFEDRVMSTYVFMQCMIRAMHEDGKQLSEARQKTIAQTQSKSTFDLDWALDMESVEQLRFKGYEAKYKPSEVSGLDRLYYDRNAPYEKDIPYYKNYKPALSIEKPQAYIIPQAYEEVIERLQWNGVAIKRLAADIELEVELYRITDYQSTKGPYEGHYLHSKVKVDKQKRSWPYFKGDYVIFTDQAVNRYIIETLEPQAPDSWFAWNFFDGILMQKEYFSSYVFEDLAAEYLKADPALRAELEAEKKANPKLAESARAQLDFVYKRTAHYERTHQVYPVGRLHDAGGLSLVE